MPAPRPAAPDPKRLVGQTLPGGWRLDRFIGAGAFAWVYLATGSDGEPFAIKVLQNATHEAARLFVREIKVLRQLPPSPYCVRYVADGTTLQRAPFLVMEYVDGCTLKDAIKFKPVWETREAAEMMLQLCDALAGLHKLGVAHRDLKPENVMLTRDWQVKLMDFGLVKDAQGLLKLFESEDILTGRDFAENIDKAMLAGTPEYMAPEQFNDAIVEDESQVVTDTWTDVYSLGLIFWQLLTGKKLFPFTPDNTNQGTYARSLLSYIRDRTMFHDEDLHAPFGVPSPLWKLIAQSLRHDPRRRPHGASDLGRELRNYLDTGFASEFDDEATFAGDMGSVLRKMTALRTDARGGNKRSSRPPPGITMGDGEGDNDETEVFTSPKIDVAAVQAYSDKRLNATAGPRYTLPPGALFAKDVPGLHPAVQPAPVAFDPTRPPRPALSAASTPAALLPRDGASARAAVPKRGHGGWYAVAAVVALALGASGAWLAAHPARMHTYAQRWLRR